MSLKAYNRFLSQAGVFTGVQYSGKPNKEPPASSQKGNFSGTKSQQVLKKRCIGVSNNSDISTYLITQPRFIQSKW